MQKGIIERAYEIAQTGDCQTVTQIKAVLKRERYTSIDMTLQGAGLRREPKAMMRAARASLAA